MKVYIDLEHLKSLANNMDKEVLKLIRENFDIYYCFDEKDIKKEKRQKIQKIENWQKNLSEGRNNKSIKYNSEIPTFHSAQSPNPEYQDFLQTVFLKNCDSLPKGVLSSEIGKELYTFRNLLIEGKCVPAKFYYTRPDEGKTVAQRWDIVSKNVSPCTDIIINDRYLFAESDIDYDNNSYKLIEELSKQSVGQCINIVIITREKYYMYEKDENGNKVRKSYSISKPTIKRNIANRVEKITTVKPNVTIITQKDESERMIHDRTIFTNYKLFISGDSFKYYKSISDDKENYEFVSNGLWFGICSLFDDDHRKIAKQFIHEIQGVINELNDAVEGVSNYLYFPPRKKIKILTDS